MLDPEDVDAPSGFAPVNAALKLKPSCGALGFADGDEAELRARLDGVGNVEAVNQVGSGRRQRLIAARLKGWLRVPEDRFYEGRRKAEAGEIDSSECRLLHHVRPDVAEAGRAAQSERVCQGS